MRNGCSNAPVPLCFPFYCFFSLPSYIWVSRHRWVWGFRPVQARRTVCEHLWKFWMLLYGWILPREWAWTFPPGQRHHVMHRWVSAKEGSFLKVRFCSQMTFFCWEPVSVGPVLGMWVEIICSFAHLYNLLNKVNITRQKGLAILGLKKKKKATLGKLPGFLAVSRYSPTKHDFI